MCRSMSHALAAKPISYRTPASTRAAVRPPDDLGYRTGALPPPAPPRSSSAILVALVPDLWWVEMPPSWVLPYSLRSTVANKGGDDLT